jgi:hypothetical protein
VLIERADGVSELDSSLARQGERRDLTRHEVDHGVSSCMLADDDVVTVV